MAPKLSHLLSLLVLCLSLLLFLFYAWTRYNNLQSQILSHANRRQLAQKYDFTPFINNRHHHQHHRHRHRHHHHHHRDPLGPAGSQIDPIYGAEKRLVPTGPNPLHH
ncbi:hypothetical protein SAY87_028393 [Trapa incisa]|uniref:Uncharacterized protein n=1 Tax=Trapa incisa TaxID=236973 RepID=A0AAN7QNL9_9MYRT|nr:hypothetical protein SAY87_028393 [Trapa incisa]